jgi:hypothetical protein
MQFGLRAILLLVAVVLFVLAALSDSNQGDYLAWGLAAFAGGHLAEAAGWGNRTFGTRS